MSAVRIQAWMLLENLPECCESRDVTLRFLWSRTGACAGLYDVLRRVPAEDYALYPCLVRIDRRHLAHLRHADAETRDVVRTCVDGQTEQNSRLRPALVVLSAPELTAAPSAAMSFRARLFTPASLPRTLRWPPEGMQHLGSVPPRAQLEAFSSRAVAAYRAQLQDPCSAAAPLAEFLLPHQLANVCAALAKEHLGLRLLDMLQHERFYRGGLALPWLRLDDEFSGGALVYSLSGIARDFWEPNSRSVTVINDEVGTGKTASALALLLANGARAENPLSLDPPTRPSLLQWSRRTEIAPAAAAAAAAAASSISVPNVFRALQFMKDEHTHTTMADSPGPVTSMVASPFTHLVDAVPLPAAVSRLPAAARDLPAHSRNAQHGGTLILAPHNVIDHWLDELRRLSELLRADGRAGLPELRVGVVGKGGLRRDRLISAQRLAEDYDVVMMPHTLMRPVNDGGPSSSFMTPRVLSVSLRPGCWLPDQRMPAGMYHVLCELPAGAALPNTCALWVSATSEILEARLRERGGGGGGGEQDRGAAAGTAPPAARQHFLRLDPDDPLSRRLVVRAVGLSFARQLDRLRSGHTLRIDHGMLRFGTTLWTLPSPAFPCWLRVLGTLTAETADAGPGLPGTKLGLAYPGLHTADIRAPVPAAEAALHVHWSRVVADELHLLSNPSTARCAYLLSLEADHLVGLTAERAWSDVVRRGGMRRLLLATTSPLMRRVGLEAAAMAANTLRAEMPNPCRLTTRPPMLAAAGPEAGGALQAFWSGLLRRVGLEAGAVLDEWQAMDRRGDIQRAFGRALPPRAACFASLRELAGTGAADFALFGVDAAWRLAMLMRCFLRQASFGAALPDLDAAAAEAVAAARVRERLRATGLTHLMGPPTNTVAAGALGLIQHHHDPRRHHHQHADALLRAAGAGAGAGSAGAALSNLDAAAPLPLPQVVAAGQDALVCPICFEEAALTSVSLRPADWVAIRPCGHPMCRECWDDMRGSGSLSRRCPLCRTGVAAYSRIAGGTPEEASPPAADSEEASPPAGGTPEEASPPAGGTPEEASPPAGGPGPGSPAPSSKGAMLTEALRRLSGEGLLRGAVVYFDCSDGQMEALGRQVQAALAGAVQVYSILSRHPPQVRMRTMNAVRERARLMAAAPASPAGPLPAPVLFVRYRMCAVGVNYIFANHIFMFNLPHRPELLHQAVGRLCRLGQASAEVVAHPLVFAGTLEESLWAQWAEAATINSQRRTTQALSTVAAALLRRTLHEGLRDPGEA